MDWIASLWSSSIFWERLEYVAEAIVIIGAVGEVLVDFEHILKGDNKKERRHLIGKRAAIALIIGLAIELGALVRTNQLFSETIGSLYREARDANNRATAALDRADKAEKQAGIATAKAAVLNKEAEDERLARLKIEKQLAWRTLTSEQRKGIADRINPFVGQQFEMWTYLDDGEAINFENLLYGVIMNGHWVLNQNRKWHALGGFLNGVQLIISVKANKRTIDAANSLVSALLAEKLPATVKAIAEWESDMPNPELTVVIEVGKNSNTIPSLRLSAP